MGQIVSNRTGRKRILHTGPEAEIKITAKQKDDLLTYSTEININKKHKFNDNFKISLQAYEKNGIACKPRDLGTIGDPFDLGEVSVSDINIDRILFRLKVFDDKNIIKGYATSIQVNVHNASNSFKQETANQSNTLLPVEETSNIKVPFQIDMSPGEKPVLLLKANLNLKERFKNDIITKTYIYTSAIRQILFNYLVDEEYERDLVKDQFISKIIENCGNEIEQPPENLLMSGKISEEAQQWIENALAGCMNRVVNFQGKNVSLMDQFENKCKDTEVIEDNYDED